jgi:N-acetylmuramoyl-L-alanine amidase
MVDPPESPNERVVDPGDRLSKIAHEAGVDPQAIWDHPANAELKKKRAHPEILLPGDRLFVPDKNPEQLAAKPKEVNHYQVETIPSELQVHLSLYEAPFPAGKAYEIFIDGTSRGKLATKQGGLVQFYVEPDVTEVTLVFADPPFECTLLVGHLDPIDEHGGIEQRLNNLGYACPITAPSLPSGSKAERDATEKNERLRGEAIRQFQEDAGLPLTGVMDDATNAKLDAWARERPASGAKSP